MDGKKYKTEFNKDVERLNALTSKLDKSIPFKIKYRNAIDLTFLHMTYISCLISSIFTIAYFLRAGNMQRGTKSKGGIVDMVMQKKTFDIVRQTGVKFADVAGLD